jgi:hypothetical protein
LSLDQTGTTGVECQGQNINVVRMMSDPGLGLRNTLFIGPALNDRDRKRGNRQKNQMLRQSLFGQLRRILLDLGKRGLGSEDLGYGGVL